jgi:hypothetical protein
MGVLSRQEMVDIIKRGESVHYDGVIHWQEGTLPSEAEMAIGDESRMRAAEDSLENQIALLAAEKAKLTAARQQGKGDPAQANADARLAEEAGVGTAEGRRTREEADADEAFRREEAARRSVSDDAAAKAAQDLAKEQERRDAEEKKAEERRVAEEEKAAEESRKRAEAEAAGDSKPAGHGKGK